MSNNTSTYYWLNKLFRLQQAKLQLKGKQKNIFYPIMSSKKNKTTELKKYVKDKIKIH